MKKSLSITAKITIGATALMLLNALVVMIIALILSKNLVLGVSKGDLDDFVAASTNQISIREDVINYDSEFSFVKNGVYLLVLESDGMVVAGRYPVNSAVNIGPPQDGFRRVTLSPGDYYVVDKPIPGNIGEDSLWVRGVESVANADNFSRYLIRLLVIIMPIFVVLAGVLSFIVAKRSLSPVKKILDTVDTIKSGEDLSGRIGMNPGNDEIHRLSESFDQMFERLSLSFERERQFYTGVSHELRTPIAVIKAQVDYLQNYCDNIEEQKEGLKAIQEEIEKITAMTESMLAKSRMESGHENISSETVDLIELTKQS